MTFDQIADQLGYADASGAYRAYSRASRVQDAQVQASQPLACFGVHGEGETLGGVEKTGHLLGPSFVGHHACRYGERLESPFLQMVLESRE
jgi:hypothetical protein